MSSRVSIQKDFVDRITLCGRLTYAINDDVSKGAACGIVANNGRLGRAGEIAGSFLCDAA